MEEFYQKSRIIIAPYLKKKEIHWNDIIFKEFFSNKENFNFQFCLTHGDFDTSNILADPINFRLTGIIDFEETSIFDPATDLIFFKEGDDFLQSILQTYSNVSNDLNRLNRMRFLAARTFICYLKFGIENSRPAMIKEGLRMLQQNMLSFS